MNKKLKKYRLKINPEKGSMVDFISQVESPAIEVGFLKFHKESITEHLQLSEDKMELFGPVLIPDMLIYRNSQKMGEYEVYFTSSDIKEIQMNFMKNGFQNNINLDHTDKMASSYVFESFVSDDLIPNPEPFKHLPVGTWFVKVKVDDKNVWNDIKSGKRNGFSIEGVFDYIIDEFEKNYLEKQNIDTTNKEIDIQEKISIEIMLKSLFKKVFTELAEEFDAPVVDTPTGTPTETPMEYQKVSSSDYKITSREVGQRVEIADANKQLVPAPDGCYEFEDGFKFCVEGGVICSIDGQMDAKKCADQNMDEEAAAAPVEAPETPVEESTETSDVEDLKVKVSDLQAQIDELKALLSGLPTQQSMEAVMSEIKNEFKSVFEKFAQVPAEPSKVTKSNVVKDDAKKKFEQFVASLKK